MWYCFLFTIIFYGSVQFQKLLMDIPIIIILTTQAHECWVPLVHKIFKMSILCFYQIDMLLGLHLHLISYTQDLLVFWACMWFRGCLRLNMRSFFYPWYWTILIFANSIAIWLYFYTWNSQTVSWYLLINDIFILGKLMCSLINKFVLFTQRNFLWHIVECYFFFKYRDSKTTFYHLCHLSY